MFKALSPENHRALNRILGDLIGAIRDDSEALPPLEPENG